MVNAWSLLYDEIYGDDKMTDKKEEHGSSKDPFTEAFDYAMDEIVVSGGNTASYYPSSFNTFSDNDDQIAHHISGPANEDLFVSMDGVDLNDAIQSYEELKLNIHANSSDNSGMAETPSIKNPCNRKYKEDESIKALQDYIATTYGGHYTSEQNNVQTLDLIESVGDAESFCRSNAIKYLSRYDKKGQAKRDILKALHYTLLLYHFSGQLNETPTRGYETF